MRSRIWTLARWLAPLGLVPLLACLAPPVASPRTTVTQETNVRVDQNLKNKVDVLFMVDNSSSMDPMQLELRTRFGDFFKVFEELSASGTYADMHIGVVTSDYGAGDAVGNGCEPSPGGQRGLLQTLPSPSAMNPPANCKPPTGKPYIAYQFTPGAPVTNLPNGTDATALVDEFTCMASVGARGCGFEHQLESVYAALRNSKENADFLRGDALLTVVFVTNEDDGSAAPNAKFYEIAGNDPNGGGMYGQYTTYRQTRFAVDCGGVPIPYGMPSGLLTGCAAAPNPMAADVNTAYDISRYTSFFTLPAAQGGVKDNPDDVILVGIDGPETPFQTVLIDPGAGVAPYHPCPSPMLSQSCLEALQHSCENNVQPGFFADPGVRLNAVINSAAHHNVASICGDDLAKAPDFSNAMQKLAELISSQIGPGCINAPVASRADGTPDCEVEDVTKNPDRSVVITEIPSCAENGNVTPCWALNDLLGQYQAQGCVALPGPKPATCMLPLSCQPVTNPVDNKVQLASVSINRGGVAPPSNTTARVACATIASSSQ
ncbi:MAG: hypothetical protein JWM53_6403 [bacterium]|nr:hypothetical protein [bacterium]